MNFLDNINNFFKIQIEKSYKMIINNYKIINLLLLIDQKKYNNHLLCIKYTKYR